MGITSVPLLRFYTDSHVPKQVVIQLRARDVDVVRCQEISLEDAEDVVHLEKATSQLRTLITGDEDFPHLSAKWNQSGKFHAGILYFQHDSQGDVGLIVKSAIFLYEAVKLGAAPQLDDVYNQTG